MTLLWLRVVGFAFSSISCSRSTLCVRQQCYCEIWIDVAVSVFRSCRRIRAVGLSVSRSVRQSVSQPVSQSISQSVNHSFSHSCQPVSQSINQSISQSFNQCFSQSISQSTVSQSVRRVDVCACIRILRRCLICDHFLCGEGNTADHNSQMQ